MPRKTPGPRLNNPKILFLSFFGTGFAPFAPGTVGTLATLPFLLFLGWLGTPLWGFVVGTIALTILACFWAEQIQRKYEVHDPGWIVIDESLGLATAWCFLTSLGVWEVVAITVLFRFFDIVKVWPVSYFDRRKDGIGTILDDIVAGLMAGGTYLLLLEFLKLFTTTSS